MKGIELPINILVIIAVAVIVLIAVVAMFYPAFSGGSQTVSVESIKSAACNILTAKSCKAATSTIAIYNFDADQDKVLDGDTTGTKWCWGVQDPCKGLNNPADSGCTAAATCAAAVYTCKDTANPTTEADTLAALCKCYYGITSEPGCKALCGC